MKIGDIVIYMGEEIRYAAIVGGINGDGTLNLTVIPNGTTLLQPWSITNVPQADPAVVTDYSWHLPV